MFYAVVGENVACSVRKVHELFRIIFITVTTQSRCESLNAFVFVVVITILHNSTLMIHIFQQLINYKLRNLNYSTIIITITFYTQTQFYCIDCPLIFSVFYPFLVKKKRLSLSWNSFPLYIFFYTTETKNIVNKKTA